MKLRLLLKYFTLFEIGQLAFSRLFRLHHFYLLQKHLKNEEWSSRTIVSLPDIGLMEEEDVHRIEKTLATYSFEDRKELFIRISFWKDGFKNCYIVRKNGEIAYMQWIITQKENKLLRKKVGSIYQPLQEKQVLIENAFTFPKYRGLGIFPYISHFLCQTAFNNGNRVAITYVRKDKLVPLNEFSNRGFKITKLITEYKFIGLTFRNLKN